MLIRAMQWSSTFSSVVTAFGHSINIVMVTAGPLGNFKPPVHLVMIGSAMLSPHTALVIHKNANTLQGYSLSCGL